MPDPNITAVLLAAGDGDEAAVNKLMPLIYEELHNMAQRQLRKERSNHTLNATALVHEAYIKLIQQDQVDWQNRAHFLSVAALAMRRILINHARQRLAAKRGGGVAVATFDDALFGHTETRADELVALDEVLGQLAAMHERQAQVVQYRFFGGLTQEEIATVLDVSIHTVRRDWRIARAWLSREVKRNLQS